jgi:hypothetical protein
MNSIMERWVQTCRHQLLDCALIWNRVIRCTPSWSSSTSITSTGPTGLSGRQRGRCPLCRGLLLHADHQPQGPEEWQQWHSATRTAIRKHVITSVMDLGTMDERAAHHLIHVHCRRRISGTGPALLPAPSLQGLLEPSCPETGTAVSEGGGGNAPPLPDKTADQESELRNVLIGYNGHSVDKTTISPNPGAACSRASTSPS